MKNLSVSRQEAAQELLRRRAVRGSLTEFSRVCGYEPAPHQALIVDRIERLFRREYRRLFLFMPPGSAKSTYASVLSPAFYLAQQHAGNVICASHSVTLAERFSRKVRNLVKQHSTTLGYGLAPDSTASGRWETSKGNEYLAAGVGTGIAGFRASLGIIDDPMASREDADSEKSRETAWSWYNDDFSNRLIPGALELIIMTRWHEDDLAGRILGREDPVPTEVLSLPAIAGDDDPLGREPGEYLWEGEYGYADRLREKKATSDPRSWASMYQQNPVPDKGLFLDVGLIKREAPPPTSELRIFAASDYATKDGGGDYTVHVIGGLDKNDRLHILDLWRKQTETDVWVDQWFNMGKAWKPLEWGEEAGVIIKAVEPQMKARLRQAKEAGDAVHISREQYPSIKDKPTRARTLQARIAQGNLCIPKDAHWADMCMAEIAKFPAAKYDDQVDALALLCMVAAKFGPPKDAKPAYDHGAALGVSGGGGGGFWSS